MMNYKFDFSVIIPHRDSLHFLPKLFSTLPNSERVEIILVDNSPNPLKREDLETDKRFELIYSDPERGAGGARNEGIEFSHGKWLIFVDADDYFPEGAFKIFYSHFNSDAELIYFCMGGIYLDSGEPSNRGDAYTQLVREYLSGAISEMDIRLGFSTPCSKMVSRKLIDRYRIRYDEVIASNDIYFSLLTGYHASKIAAVDKITYIATVSKGTLTQRRDYSVIKSRFEVSLRYNKFVKFHNLPHYQRSVMIYLFQVRHYGFNRLIEFVKLLVEYKQNIFIGYQRWFKTFLSYKNKMHKDAKYITK